MRNGQSGQTLLELLVVVGVIGLFAAMTASPVSQVRKRMALLAATSELRAVFQQARMLAIARDRNVALKFRAEANGWTWTVYEDQDGDGVRNDDISRGIDRVIGAPKRFQHEPARIGTPSTAVPDPYNHSQRLDLRSPVRFGNSTICSFSRAGEASNGSLVMTDGRSAVMLRVHGASAQITVLRWDGKVWKEGD